MRRTFAITRLLGTTLATTLAVAAPAALRAQLAESRPFFVGERLTFAVRAAKVTDVGEATMWVEGPVDVRGTTTWELRFDFGARVGFLKAEDRTASWLDPERMAALRFTKYERHPLSKHDEAVEMYPAERRWRGENGSGGASPSDEPLDELSFMYFIRTLPFTADTTFSFDRHFDAARNPTTVRVVKRETVTTDAGAFRTVLLEMRVRDPRHYRGEGVIRINVSDDSLRLPVRIESAMPVAGTAVLSLSSFTRRTDAVVARKD